jgi:hypothetical protein
MVVEAFDDYVDGHEVIRKDEFQVGETTYTLKLFDSTPAYLLPGYGANDGRWAVQCILYKGGDVLFPAQWFFPPPLWSIDGDDTVKGIMSDLTLRKGDVDSDHFDNYTPEQLEFRDGDAEYLGYEVLCWYEGRQESEDE